MQKSTKREILWLQNADSRWFESVYFILKPGTDDVATEDEMLREADRIVAAALASRRGGRGRRSTDSARRFGRGFLFGVLSVLLPAALAVLAVVLFT